MATRSAIRRLGPSARRAVPPPPAPAAKVPSRSSTYLRDSALIFAAGLAACGAAPLFGYSALGVPLLVAGVVGALVQGVVGALKKRRRDLEARLLEALAPLLGVRHLDRRIVKLSRWSFGWPGTPAHIKVHYAPGAPDGDPLWLGDVVAILGSRLLAAYEVSTHRRRQCVLTLQLKKEVPSAAYPPYSQVRAARAITELIGPTTVVTGAELVDGELSAITVRHEAGAKLAASGYRNRIERVISTMLPGRWRAVWDLEGDSVRFEVRPTLPTSVWLPARRSEDTEDLLRNYRQVKIPVAVDEDQREVFWYPARVPHVMLTGGTGTGKTSMAHALVGQITQNGWPVWVADAKRVEFLGLRSWPNVQIVAGSIAHQVALVRAAWELMEYRYQLIEDGKATLDDFEPLVVFLDEFAEFRSNLVEWYAQIKVKGDPTRPPTLLEVASLARKGRTARVHLVLSTQRPDAEFLGGEMRDNFGFRMSMGRLSPQGAMMMWENPAVGVSLPRACTGRAIATHEDGRPVEVQCYRFPDLNPDPSSEEARLLAAITPTEARWPRLVIVPPEWDLDDNGANPPTFRDYASAKWDLAEKRPDLDPMSSSHLVGDVDGRALSSTMSSLGIQVPADDIDVDRIADVLVTARVDQERPHLRVVRALEPADPTDADVDDAPADEYAGYAPPSSCTPSDLIVGDLIEVEQGSGEWVVVDEQPEDDPIAPGLVAVSWRGDGDESGSISLPDDALIPVRRPEEEAS